MFVSGRGVGRLLPARETAEALQALPVELEELLVVFVVDRSDALLGRGWSRRWPEAIPRQAPRAAISARKGTSLPAKRGSRMSVESPEGDFREPTAMNPRGEVRSIIAGQSTMLLPKKGHGMAKAHI